MQLPTAFIKSLCFLGKLKSHCVYFSFSFSFYFFLFSPSVFFLDLVSIRIRAVISTRIPSWMNVFQDSIFV